MVIVLLAACAVSPEGGETAPVDVLEWLYGDVVVPDTIVGAIEVEHDGDPRGVELEFTARAWFYLEPPVLTWSWSDPFEGLGDCGAWPDPPTSDGTYTGASVGTIFLDAGFDAPYVLAPLAGGYIETYLQTTPSGPPAFGDVFAVAAVGDDFPAFDWDPAFALPSTALQVTWPEIRDGGETPATVDPFEVTWLGEDPHGVVVIEISAGGRAGIYCEAPDTGAFTVPSEMLAPYAGQRVGLYVTRTLDRYELVGPDQYVRLRTTSGNRMYLQLE